MKNTTRQFALWADTKPARRKLSREDAAYLAGIIDGEGSITINRKRATGVRSVKHDLRVIIGNTNLGLMTWVHERMGGWLAKAGTRKPRNPRYKDFYFAVASGPKALAILEQVLPYLKVKRQRAIIGIEFQRRMGNAGPVKLTEEEIAVRDQYRSRLMLN